jgi:hypothetical protein
MSQWFEKILEDVDKLDVFNEDSQKSERGRGKANKAVAKVPMTEDVHVTHPPVEEGFHHHDVERAEPAPISVDASIGATHYPPTPSSGGDNATVSSSAQGRNLGQYVGDETVVDVNRLSASELDESDVLRENKAHATSVFRDFIVSSSALMSNLPDMGENANRSRKGGASAVAGPVGGGTMAQSLYQTARAAAAIAAFEEEEDIDDFEFNDPILKKIQANKERMMSGKQLSYGISNSTSNSNYSTPIKSSASTELTYARYDSSTKTKHTGYDGSAGTGSTLLSRGTIFNGYNLFHSDALPPPAVCGERYHQNNPLLLVCYILYGILTLIVDRLTGRSRDKSLAYISARVAETKALFQDQWLQRRVWEKWYEELDIIVIIEYATSPYGFGALTFLLLYYMYFKFGRYSTDVIDK